MPSKEKKVTSFVPGGRRKIIQSRRGRSAKFVFQIREGDNSSSDEAEEISTVEQETSSGDTSSTSSTGLSDLEKETEKLTEMTGRDHVTDLTTAVSLMNISGAVTGSADSIGVRLANVKDAKPDKSQKYTEELRSLQRKISYLSGATTVARKIFRKAEKTLDKLSKQIILLKEDHDLQNNDNTSTFLDSKRKDPTYFKNGQDLLKIRGFKSKRKYLGFRAQSRILCILQRLKKAVNERLQDSTYTEPLFQKLAAALLEAHHHRYFFQMDGIVASPFCDKEGRMRCSGAWNKKSCPRQAQIFPFRNWLQRCELTNWNIEHIITIKSMVDFIVKLGKSMPTGKKFSCTYFYKLLFLPPNIKFVERCCHVGGEVGRSKVDFTEALIDVDVVETLDVFDHPHA